MALGDSYGKSYSGVQKKEIFRPTLFGYSFTNTSEDVTEKSRLSFSMWKSTIKVSIAKLVGLDQNGFNNWDRDNQAVIYLTPVKANTFAHIIEKFVEDPVKYDGYGVTAGKGFISINNNDGRWTIMIYIVNPESGKAERIDGYEVKRSNFAIYAYDGNGSFEKDEEGFKDEEIYMIIAQLKDYAEAANNAIAFAVADSLASNHDYTSNMLNKIASACGVSGSGASQARSYFAGGSNSSSSSGYASTRTSVKAQEASFDDF